MKIEAECKIPASQAECFKAFADLESLAAKVDAIQKIELLTTGEIGVGSKFKETRVMFGKESSEIMEITLFEPHTHIREEAHSGGSHYTSDWRFTESDGQTSVTITFNIQPETLVAKLLSPVFFLMAGSLKKAFVADMADIKRAICGS
ncbi:MAG: SRPBCC family protein [Bdellovibrionales bacterium]|nr:SRPBCC family protein [Bdellovibrionales bacterium]